MKHSIVAAMVAVGCLLFSPDSLAISAARMDLATIVDSAGHIFRGKVMDVDKGVAQVGGGQIDTVVYTIAVTDPIKGNFPEAEEGKVVLQLTSVSHRLIDLPKLDRGREYLLMTTEPSSAGLSTMVGLDQGTFVINADGSIETVENGRGNKGLFPGSSGPIRYQEFVQRVRAAAGGKR